jgi:hypothetical protein
VIHRDTGKFGYRACNGRYVHIVRQRQNVWEKDGSGHKAGDVESTYYRQTGLCGANLYNPFNDGAYPTLAAGKYEGIPVCPRCARIHAGIQGGNSVKN